MRYNKEEFGKTIYGIGGSLITAFFLFLFGHLGNILNLTKNDKNTSITIWVLFLYLLIIGWAIFVWVKKNENKKYIFKKGIRILGITISSLATVGLILIISFSGITQRGFQNQVPTYLVKFVNTQDSTISIYSNGEVWVNKPSSPASQIELYFGYFDLSQNNVINNISILPKDTVLASVNFRGTTSISKLLDYEELEMTLRFRQLNDKFIWIQGIPFNENTLKKTFIEVDTK